MGFSVRLHMQVHLFLVFITFATLGSHTPPVYGNTVPGWLQQATMGHARLYPRMDDAAVEREISLQESLNVSVFELDTGLSDYHSAAEFARQVDFIDDVATRINSRGLHSVIYIPSLEVVTPDGVHSSTSMYKDHPGWVQRGINGEPNVFYGNQQFWVSPDAESAWMSPNTRYKKYFIKRIRQLAATAVDGIWLDVPIYLETGAGWAGTEPAAARDFRRWTRQQRLNNGAGFDMPKKRNFDDAAFRAFLKWRHINLAKFLEDVRSAATDVNPDIAILVEDYPMDYMDATRVGLDAGYLDLQNNLIVVSELGSVSNQTAMTMKIR